jgi:hypothetical protein
MVGIKVPWCSLLSMYLHTIMDIFASPVFLK